MKKMYIDGIEIGLGGSGSGVSEEQVTTMIDEAIANSEDSLKEYVDTLITGAMEASY